MFNTAKWIWVDDNFLTDSYGEFYSEFNWDGGDANCLLSCDGDYTLYINGEYVASNQYGDYEWYKSYDSVDITPYLKKGKNSIAVLVWHFGIDSQRYIKAKAGLIFELQSNGEVVLASGENTLARYSKAYKQGAKKLVTRQLGFSFAYDSTEEDDWKTTGKGLQSAVLVDKNCSFVERPTKKLKLLELVHGRVVLSESNHYIIDLGTETVGLVSLDFISPTVQKIVVAWGEDLQDGHVRQRIEHRDFSFDYIAKAGKNEYVNYMLRLGCRYLQVDASADVTIEEIGIQEIEYPFIVKPYEIKNPLRKRNPDN